MSRRFRMLVTRALAILVLGGTLAGSFAAPADAATLDSFESDLHRVVNEFRASKGLPTLQISDTLTFSAKWMAQDMAVNWMSLSRPATTTTPYVGPGQDGWFQFTVKAPAAPGTYRLAVRGVIDGTTWLEDTGVSWTVTVR